MILHSSRSGILCAFATSFLTFSAFADASLKSAIGPIKVAGELAAKGGAKNAINDAVPFNAPNGDGRRGAKGLLLKLDPSSPDKGSVWRLQFTRSQAGQLVQFIHPVKGGQVVAQVRLDDVNLSSPERWSDVGYAFPEKNDSLKKTAAFGSIFPLKDNQTYSIVSKITPGGRWELTIDGKIVAHGQAERPKPLSLEIPANTRIPGGNRQPSHFEGANLPMKWQAGWAAVIIGPIDSGKNVGQDIQYEADASSGK